MISPIPFVSALAAANIGRPCSTWGTPDVSMHSHQEHSIVNKMFQQLIPQKASPK